MDFFPSRRSKNACCVAGGDPKRSGLHGRDIAGYMTGKSTEAPHDVLYWHVGSGPQDLSGVLREGDYKMLAQRGKVQLFNLKEDPAESNDLSKAEPRRAERMLTQWIRMNENSQQPLWGGGQSKPAKDNYQYTDYEWLKGTPHYRAKN